MRLSDAGKMMDLMIIAATAMQQDATRLQGIAQNLSNALTPGYKKQIVATGGFAAQFSAASNGPVQAASVMPAPVRLLLDPSSGTLRNTGEPSDIAIDGDGYFELASSTGPLYTRRGALRLDAAGRLVGPQDLPVMGAGGEIVLGGDPFTIKPNGDIVQGGATVARLRVVRFQQAEFLEPTGGGSYAQGAAVIDDVAAPVRLRIGYQENSNVDTGREMVGLTETMRHFEAMQKIVQGYDEVLEKSIRKLGEF
jgi:flagellar basal-body rod protein FlgF